MYRMDEITLPFAFAVEKPRGSKYPIFKDSGPKTPYPQWLLGPEFLNIGYLDPLGLLLQLTKLWDLNAGGTCS